jgi:hypothetical protein
MEDLESSLVNTMLVSFMHHLFKGIMIIVLHVVNNDFLYFLKTSTFKFILVSLVAPV